MIDFNHGATKKGQTVPTVEQLDRAAMQVNAGSPDRDYLGGSRLGEDCARKLQYEFEGAVRKPFPARIHNIFAIGHAGEDAVAALLKRIYDLKTVGKDGRQLGFSTAGGRIRGHVDGVVVGGPADLGPYPFIWEHKWVGAKYWRALVKHGLAKERPVYAGQVATYQAYMDLEENPALFSFGNRDTGEVAFERVPFDPKLAQECTDRGVQVITATKAGERIPRPFPDEDYFKCRFCDFREVCWS